MSEGVRSIAIWWGAAFTPSLSQLIFRGNNINAALTLRRPGCKLGEVSQKRGACGTIFCMHACVHAPQLSCPHVALASCRRLRLSSRPLKSLLYRAMT